MIVFVRAVGDIPSPFFREELKNEFYKWINATGINTYNCPKRLACLLLGTHEILEGEDGKIEQESEHKQRTLDPNSPEYAAELNKLFVNIQGPLRSERVEAQSLAGKTYNDMIISNKFSGNAERGKLAFNQIVATISTSDYQNFHFFPQKEGQWLEMDMDLQ